VQRGPRSALAFAGHGPRHLKRGRGVVDVDVTSGAGPSVIVSGRPAAPRRGARFDVNASVPWLVVAQGCNVAIDDAGACHSRVHHYFERSGSALHDSADVLVVAEVVDVPQGSIISIGIDDDV
jgi:hypothetical protein